MATTKEGCSISTTILASSPTLQANPRSPHLQPLSPPSAAQHLLLLGRKPAGKAGWAKYSFQEQVFTRHQFNAWEYSGQGFSPNIPALILDNPFPSPVFTASIECSARKKHANTETLCTLSHKERSVPSPGAACGSPDTCLGFPGH